MKIINSDNFGRETIADRLICENVKSAIECEAMVKGLRLIAGECDWYHMVDDDFELYKGVEILI